MSLAGWENALGILEGDFSPSETLPPVAQHEALPLDESFHQGPIQLDSAIGRDTSRLPTTRDREGYHGDRHFAYWASGLRDTNMLLTCAESLGVPINDYLDIGCASGRVIRHFAHQCPDIRVTGCDISQKHIDWITSHLPRTIRAVQNFALPTLPFADGAFDLISAFSVFTHIESFETAWLMEMERILRPGGIAWVTVHTQHTWEEMDESWPLHRPIANHPRVTAMQDRKALKIERNVFRWHADRSYTANVFYSTDYIERVWGRIFDISAFHRRHPGYQDVYVLRKRAQA